MLLESSFCASQLRGTELRLLIATGAYEGGLRALEEELVAIEATTEDLDDLDHPATWLRRRLGLTATEERALWLLVGCELSPKVRVLARQLATEQVFEPTIDVIRRVVYGAATALACREIDPRARIFTWRLAESTETSEVPTARRTVRIAERVIALVHGDRELDSEIESISEARPISLSDLVIDDHVSEAVGASMEPERRAVTMLIGGRATGRRSLIEAHARKIGRRTLVIDAARIAHERRVATCRAIAREATLLERVVVIRGLDCVAASQRSELFATLDQDLVRRVSTPIFVTTSESLRLRWSRDVTVVEVPPLRQEQRALVWRRALPEASEASAHLLAIRHPIAPGLVHTAVAAARTKVIDVDHTAVAQGIAHAIDDGLAAYATRVASTQTWDELVLPEDQLAVITELLARASNREHVYERWGFAAKIGRGLGISALFSGPPGTGKTMVAGLIARELGLECYQIDLAKMVSKWVGETEKNLAALFDAAEAAHAVLLFDEADSLFGKRTQVTSANDRYANLEVNYLLQRMETFSGISILTTNHESSIDEAFRRRLSLHLRFPVPEAAEREKIWRAMLPSAAAVDCGVDFRGIAARFSMSGGYIKNAVLRAAFLAASEGRAIGMHHFEYAAHVEYEGMGKIVPRTAAT